MPNPSLRRVAVSIRESNLGRNWPEICSHFFVRWAFLNRAYSDLNPNRGDWEGMVLFIQDPGSQDLWPRVRSLDSTLQLAQLPCVGEGQRNEEPKPRVRVAFRTLRHEFSIDTSQLCQNRKCQSRSQHCAPGASQADFNIRGNDTVALEPFGAVLTIIYQIRNNLLHGSKMDWNGPERARNEVLVTLGADILEAILDEISKRHI